MGLAKGIFMVDSHVHAQRLAYKFQEKGEKPNYAALMDGMGHSESYSNAPRLLYHMDRYDVNVCVIMPAFGMTNERNMEIVREHPDRLSLLCSDADLHDEEGAVMGYKGPFWMRSGGYYWTRGCSSAFVEACRGRRQQVVMSGQQKFEEYCGSMEQVQENTRSWPVPQRFPSGFMRRGPVRAPGSTTSSLGESLLCPIELAAPIKIFTLSSSQRLCHRVAGSVGSCDYLGDYEICLMSPRPMKTSIWSAGQWWAELCESP
jgi:hypothetical protein